MKINPTQQTSLQVTPKTHFAGTRVVLDQLFGPLKIFVESPSRDGLPYDTLQLKCGDKKWNIQASELAQYADALDSFPPDAPSAETDALKLANRMVGVFRQILSIRTGLGPDFTPARDRILSALDRLGVSVERNMATHGTPDTGFKAVFKESD